MPRYTIIDHFGRVLGEALDAAVPSNFRHGDTVRVPLRARLPTMSAGAVIRPATMEVQHFILWEVITHEGRSVRQRWYLVAPDDMPEEVWKASNFLDLRHAWPNTRGL
jgi:hypothetical protein